jgi:mono/diheme cytochrome c family protein
MRATSSVSASPHNAPRLATLPARLIACKPYLDDRARRVMRCRQPDMLHRLISINPELRPYTIRKDTRGSGGIPAAAKALTPTPSIGMPRASSRRRTPDQVRGPPMRSPPTADAAPTRHLVAQHLVIALVLFGTIATAWGQDIEHGRRLAERWCAACHATGTAPTRFHRAPPLAAIAARQDVSPEMITSFLLLPHATMPSLPVSRQDAADIAAFIMEMKK